MSLIPKSNQKAAKDPEPIRELIARSSLGGGTWCYNCKHVDLVHINGRCVDAFAVNCPCTELRPMTAEEWLDWKGL